MVARSALTRLLSVLPVVAAAASAAVVTVVAARVATVAKVATVVVRAATAVVRVTVARAATVAARAVTRCSCHEAYEGLDVISTFFPKVVTYAGLRDKFAGPVRCHLNMPITNSNSFN
jgi:hypothetical protein